MDWLKKILEENKGTDETLEAVKKAIPEHFVSKSDFNAKNELVKTLKGEVEKLSTTKTTKEGEDYQEKFNTLQNKYDTDKADYEAKIKDLEWSSAAKLELAGKTHDIELVLNLLDKSKPVAEQLPELQKTKAFLFTSEEKPIFSGVKPVDGKPQTKEAGTESIGERLAKQQTVELAEGEKNPYFQ